jgi:hypothetical protein
MVGALSSGAKRGKAKGAVREPGWQFYWMTALVLSQPEPEES